MTDTEPSNKPLTWLVLATIPLVLLMSVLSAYVRLTNAGLGCADWPACYGLVEFAAGAGPVVAPGAGLAQHITATLVGLFVVGIAVLAWRDRGNRPRTARRAATALGLTICLSLLGLVTPATLHPIVALGNLLGGMVLLGLLWWLWLRALAAPAAVGPDAARLRPWARAGLALLMLQTALGGWVSANFAAAACPELAGCGAPWSFAGAREMFDLARTLSLGAGGAVLVPESAKALHIVHRLGAFLTLFYLGWLSFRAAQAGAALRAAGYAILVPLAAEFLLGLASVAGGLPLAVVTLHNAAAALLLLGVIYLYHRLTPAKTTI